MSVNNMIRFENMELEGFRSWSYSVLDLSYPGITLLSGRTGSGKSSLVEAIYWALYGVSLRGGEVSTRLADRTSRFRGTRVTVQLTIDGRNVEVSRYKDFRGERVGHKSPLIVFVDGTELSVGSKTDAQEQLVRLLGLNATAFRHAVMLPQRSTSLLRSRGIEQRAALDAFFSLDWLVEAKMRAEVAMAPLKNEFVEVSNRLTTLSLELSNLRELYKIKDERFELDLEQHGRRRKDLETHELDLLEQVRTKDSLIAAKEKQLEALPVPEVDTTLPGEVNKRQALLSRLAHNKQTLLEKMKDLEGSYQDTSTCSACGQLLPPERHQERLQGIEHQMTQVQEAYDLTVIEYDKVLKQFTELQDRLLEQEGYLAQMKHRQDHEAELKTLHLEAASLGKSLESVRWGLVNLVPPVDDRPQTLLKIQEHEGQYGLQQKYLAEVQSKLEVVSWWSSTGFGAKGLREHVVKYLLQQVNSRIDQYAGTIGLTVRLDFAKGELQVQVLDKRGLQVDYEDLSGGEQQCLELAMTLALHDCLSVQQPVNVLFLDEPMTNVDDEATYEVFELLRQSRAGVFLMTHTAADMLNVRHLRVEKTDTQGSIFS